MPTLLDAMESMQAHLVANGVRAVIDPRDLNGPCVYIAPPSVRWRFAGGDFDAEWELRCAVVAAGRRAEIVELSALVDTVTKILAGNPVEGRPDEISTGDGGPMVPCYVLSFTSRVRSVDR